MRIDRQTVHVTIDASLPSSEDDSGPEDAGDADAAGADPTTSAFCIGSEDAVNKTWRVFERQAQNECSSDSQHLDMLL